MLKCRKTHGDDKMEILDVFDKNGNRTGRTIERGQPLQVDEYVLVVNVYIYNLQGEYLIQKRSMMKEFYPGVWDVTAGTVLSGEDSKTAAVREVFEEVGISLDEENMIEITRIVRDQLFLDIWHVKADFEQKDCILQETEVDEIRLVSPKQLIQTVFEAENRDDSYKAIVEGFIYK